VIDKTENATYIPIFQR